MSARRAQPERCTVRTATPTSFSTQNPSAWSGIAWCVPPARLPARPSCSAMMAALTVPCTARRLRFTSASLHGSPMRRSSGRDCSPRASLSRYAREWTSSRSAQSASRGAITSSGRTRPSSSTIRRSAANFAIGNGCFGGSGTT